MKKVFALILALAMTLSLAACGSSGAQTSAAKSSAAKSSAAQSAAQSAAKSSTTKQTYTLTDPVNVILLSQGPGSDDYITTASEAKVLGNALPKGSNVTQETTSSGCSSVGYLIEAGMGDFGTGQNAMSATVGMEGKSPYTKVDALFATVKYAFVAELATKKYVDKTGYSTVADVLKNKAACRFVAEPVGSSDYVSFMYLLDIYGVTEDDIKSWGGSVTFTDGSACCDMLQDGQADMMVGHTVATSSNLTELCMSTDMVVSGLTDEEIKGMCQRGYSEASIPSGAFGGAVKSEMASACQASSKVVSADMSNEEAYAITKALVENREALATDVAGYKDITYKDMVDANSMVVPMHPGAKAYFQDIGVLDASGNYIGEAK
jgi:TRAP transporter TAXI family solute receptor